MPGTSIIAHLDNASKSFGRVHAVKALTLSLPQGEIYGLLGPNGAGKSTALFLLAGLLAPSEGTCRVKDHAAYTLEAKRAIGFLGPTTQLFARLTPRETLTYFGKIYGLDTPTLAKRLEFLTHRLGLAKFFNRPSEALSTGERQRVSIARALLHDPALLILDEPTSGLDVMASRFLRELIQEERQRGKAVIFSTHYLTEAELLCDRIGFLHQGSLLAEGTPAELRSRQQAASLEEAFLSLATTKESTPAA
jgi:sodium transport system ATP-binding protein